MKNNASLIYGFFLVVGDFLALVAAFGGAYVLRVTLDARPLIEQIPALTYLGVFLALLPFWIIIFALIGLYDSSIYEKRFNELGRLFIGSFMGLLFVIAYDFVSKHTIFPARLVPIYGFILAFAFLVIFRNLARYIRSTLFAYNIGLTNVLIVGNTKVTEQLVDMLRHSRTSGYRIVGIVGNKHFDHFPTYNTFEEALKKLGPGRIHRILQTELYADTDKNNEMLNYALQHHISYRLVPGNSDLFIGNIAVELFAGLPVVAVHQTALIGWGRVVKRLFDALVSMLLIIILSPVFLIIAVLEKLFDPKGKVFFRQIRLTRFNREFQVFKFRTLKRKYNGLSPEEGFELMGRPDLSKEFRANGDFLDKDPRLTKLGLFLRKTSLDELPQFFNVLMGDISLVGPRALVPAELNTYEKKHAILSVKSGLTGLAQISGRKDISFDERRKLDMYYVQNWSFWLDVVILLKTLKVVFTGSGAK